MLGAEMNENSFYSISPIEFEKRCKAILEGYAEEEGLKEFSIIHNKHLSAHDGNYQIDIYAEFTALGVRFKVLCECKRYKNKVKRDIVSSLHGKMASLGTHKGIILSTSGFQSGAIEYAKKHGIALIQVDDYNFNHISHSSGNEVHDENDPFYYMETHMPTYVAYDCTTDADEPVKVYPTRKILRELLLIQVGMIEELYGLEINVSKDLE